MPTREGIQKALEFAQGAISNSSAVPTSRVETYYQIFKDRNISDEEIKEAVKEVVLNGSNFLPKPKEILDAALKLKPRILVPAFEPSETRAKNPPPANIRELFKEAKDRAMARGI